MTVAHEHRHGLRAAFAVLAVAVGLPPSGAAAGDDAFTIGGEVDGLYPGAVLTLEAVVRNPQDFEIRITAVSVRVGAASAGCPASMLVIDDVTPDLDIAPAGVGVVPLQARMLRRAPDACQNVVFPLEFVATAVADQQGRGGGGGLPPTGAGVGPVLAVAAAAVGAGALLVRRERSRSR